MPSCVLLDVYPTSPLAKNKEKIPWAFWRNLLWRGAHTAQQARFKSLVEGGENLNSIRNRRGRRDKPYFLPQQVHLAVKKLIVLSPNPAMRAQLLAAHNCELGSQLWAKNGWILKFLECHIIRSGIWQIVWTRVFSWKALLLTCNILRAAEWRVD